MALTRGLPGPALTDWAMVIPSIFRAGTCFMGFSAWNSSENCGDKALRSEVAWPKLARAGPGQQEDPRPAAHPTFLPWGRPWLQRDTWGIHAVSPDLVAAALQDSSQWPGYVFFPVPCIRECPEGPAWGKDLLTWGQAPRDLAVTWGLEPGSFPWLLVLHSLPPHPVP